MNQSLHFSVATWMLSCSRRSWHLKPKHFTATPSTTWGFPFSVEFASVDQVMPVEWGWFTWFTRIQLRSDEVVGALEVKKCLHLPSIVQMYYRCVYHLKCEGFLLYELIFLLHSQTRHGNLPPFKSGNTSGVPVSGTLHCKYKAFFGIALALIPLLPRNWPVPFMVRCGHGFPSRTQGTDLPLCTELLQILYIRRKPPLECHEAHMSKTTEDDVRWSGLHNLRQPAKVKWLNN
jgi:hypothetical protein